MINFSDDLLVAGSTVIRAVHITELRSRIDALRARFGLGPYSYLDLSLAAAVTTIKAQHIIDLRAALLEVYIRAGLTPPSCIDPLVGSGIMVKATRIIELRTAVIAIE